MAATRKTKYVVLFGANGVDWKVDGPIQQAHSAEAAVKQAAGLRAESGVEPSGMYLAVPASSFKATPITVETQTVIKLNDAPAPT